MIRLYDGTLKYSCKKMPARGTEKEGKKNQSINRKNNSSYILIAYSLCMYISTFKTNYQIICQYMKSFSSGGNSVCCILSEL